MVILRADDVTVRYGRRSEPALERLSIEVAEGEIVVVCGPSGSGKSTAARVMSGLLAPSQGTVTIRGVPASDVKARERARTVGFVPQVEESVPQITVREAVMLGRYCRLGPVSRPRRDDEQVVDRSIRACLLDALADRAIDTLSSGERQRVRIARSLAQDPAALVLDEPTANLDFGHASECYELLRSLAASGLGVLLVTHDLNAAARYADRMLILSSGRVAAQGSPRAVIRSEIIAEAFGWPVSVDLAGPHAVPMVIPESRGRARL